jgi:hypothetical protein
VPADPADAAHDRADRSRRAQLCSGDLDALVEEHRSHPYGPHSDELARLLTYFRQADTAGKYVVYSGGDEDKWVIGRLTRRGEQPRIDLGTTAYASSALAQQAVLEARVEALRHAPGDTV